MFSKKAHNAGDDLAGTVAAVGEDVTEFHVGDRVAAFHEMLQPNGAYAEYAIAPAATTFHIPEKTSFEEVRLLMPTGYTSRELLTTDQAATLPLAAMTAAVGLYLCLGLPEPWLPTVEKIPLIVYGGSGAVGAFAIKFARASNIHPIIAVAGKGSAFVETLLDRSKGDTIVDYRDGDAAVVSGIRAALAKNGVSDVFYAFDAVSEKGSFQNISKVLTEKGGKITLVLPGEDYSAIPQGIEQSFTMVGRVHQDVDGRSKAGKAGVKTGAREFGYVFYRLMTKALQDGWLTGHPYAVLPGGLDGVQEGLADLKAGKASATKYVCRIADTMSRL
jgi:NADPH:quinone reductase-like Zn-dependent oxidoreductase